MNARSPWSWSPRQRQVMAAGILMLIVWIAPAGAEEWSALRRAVVDLEIWPAGATAPQGLTYGFVVEGVDGIVASRRMVAGADRLTARTAAGGVFEITEYVAADPAADLVLLKTAEKVGPALVPGSHQLLSGGQAAHVLLPPSVTQMDTYRVRLVNIIAAPEAGELLTLWGDISTGLPAADSLGKVVGMIEAVREGSVFAVLAVPIERVTDLLARPDTGGPLSRLAQTPPAAWTRPETPEGAATLGAALCRARRYSSGLSFLTRALQQKPDLPEAKLEMGIAYQTQGEHAEAERLYREALALRSPYALAHVYLGSCFFSQGRNADAGEQYRIALDQDPNLALAHINLGGVLFADGKLDEAEAAFQRAVTIDSNMGLAHYNLAMLYRSAGRESEFRTSLEFLEARGSGYAGLLTKEPEEK